MSSQGYTEVRWLRARGVALKRAHYRCSVCRDVRHLRVHHLDGLGMTGPRATDPTNLCVLCERCHRRKHAALLSRSPDATAVVIPRYRRD